MGSIIQATPLLQTLKKSYPAAEITFVTSSANLKLLESIGVVDRILIIDDRAVLKIIRSTFQVLRLLWKNRADLYIDLETYSYFSTALATMSCATNRFGFYRIERNIRMGVYTHMMFFNARAPIAQSYLQMARLAGCNAMVESLFRFNVSEPDRMTTAQKVIAVSGSATSSYTIINPNASDLRVERRWPAEKFIALINSLRSKYPDKKFLLIGAANEFHWVKKIHDALDAEVRECVFNTAGLFTLYELFSLIEQSELVITNDTGPMHISFAFSRPTTSLFGPASPSQYGQNPNAYGIYKNIYCSPCVHDFLTPPCRGDNQCMKKITVDEVMSLCGQL
jgi:ADP-heptose:LPS heptosyltransferase